MLKLIFPLILLSETLIAENNPNLITWPIEVDNPPYYIDEGPYNGQGSLQILLKFIKKEMPDYNHKTTWMSYKRRLVEIESKHQLCDLIGGSASKQMVYSIPTSIIRFNSGIYFWPETFSKEWADKQDIDINELSSMTDKRGAFLQIYGEVYPFLNNGKNTISPQVRNIFQMFLAKRVDYIFSSAEETNYYKTQKNIKDKIEYKIFKDRPIIASRLRSKGEHPNQKDLLVSYSYATCPNNEWGKKVINRLNEALRKIRKMKEYRDAHLRWVPDELKQQAEKAYDIFEESEIPVASFDY